MANDPRRTDSGIEIKPVYDARDLEGWDPDAQLGDPGKPPYTRGIRPDMYRGRL
jgi:methylmalonyl-CoA mutase N-terminal domain/subunit